MNKYIVGQKYVGVDVYGRKAVIQINKVGADRIYFDVIKGSHPFGWCDINSIFEETLKPFYGDKQKEIHITTDGIKYTYGVLKENGKVVKKVEAKCCPSDTFDFEVGSKLVMERLFPNPTVMPNESNVYAEVKREAKKDEYVKVVSGEGGHEFKIGEIVKCISSDSVGRFQNPQGEKWWMYKDRYVVLEGYKPKEADAKEPKKVVEVEREAKEGEYVKVTANKTRHQFKNGQVVKCVGTFLGLFPIFIDDDNIQYGMNETEYVVLENYRGE